MSKNTSQEADCTNELSRHMSEFQKTVNGLNNEKLSNAWSALHTAFTSHMFNVSRETLSILKELRDSVAQGGSAAVAHGDGTDGKTKKTKKPRDPNRPKAALSAFFIYKDDPVVKAEVRAELEASGAEFNGKDVLKHTSEKWKLLDDKARAPYAKRAEADKVRFHAEMAKYKVSQEGEQQEAPVETPVEAPAPVKATRGKAKSASTAAKPRAARRTPKKPTGGDSAAPSDSNTELEPDA